VCGGKDVESMHGREEQDMEIRRWCVGLKAARAARRGQVKGEQPGGSEAVDLGRGE